MIAQLRSLRFIGTTLVILAFIAGLWVAWTWVQSGAKWKAHLAAANAAGVTLYYALQNGTAPPEGVRVSEMAEVDQRLALQGKFQRLLAAPVGARVTNVPVLPDSENRITGKALNLTILSPDLVYKLADLPLRDGQTAAETTGWLFQQLAFYCSDPLVVAQMGSKPWVQIDGRAVWGCDAAPRDMRLWAVVAALLAIGALTTIAMNGSTEFTRFADQLRSRRRIGGPNRYTIQGPQELQDIVAAVNSYLEAEREQLENRAVVLSGVSHDLGTPATRLRLRAALIADQELRGKLEADIDSMTGMIDSVLTYTRAEMNVEAPRKLSLTSLIEAIVSDYEDTGRDVTLVQSRDMVVQGGSSVFMSRAGQGVLSGERDIVISGRPVSLQRAMTNLIDNALKYGRRATVELRTSADEVTIIVTDNGGQTTAADIQALLAPFKRGNNIQAVDGYGLGLTIVSTIAAMHGGTLRFEDASPGLRALLAIPRS